MEKRKNCRRMFLVGAVLMVSIIMFTGPAFAGVVSLPSLIDFGEVDVGVEKSAELVISHTASAGEVVGQITLTSDCPYLSLDATSVTMQAGETGSVFVYFKPTQAGQCEGTMTLQFTWYSPLGNLDLGTQTVTVKGSAPEEPGPAPVDMGSILDFFDTSVSVINPGDKGRKRAANTRLKDIRRMLVMADTWIQNGEEEKACRILNVVRKKIDRKNKPGSAWDDAKGEALAQLDDMVSQVMADLACPSGRVKKNKHK